jgi:hypothetical protein
LTHTQVRESARSLQESNVILRRHVTTKRQVA